MKKGKIYRSLFTVEVLSEEPIDCSTSLTDLLEECNNGDYSGMTNLVYANHEVTGKRAANLVIKQGSDPEFFMMDENGNELED